MFEGGILKEGTPKELADDELVRKVYLGEEFRIKGKKEKTQFVKKPYYRMVIGHTYKQI